MIPLPVYIDSSFVFIKFTGKLVMSLFYCVGDNVTWLGRWLSDALYLKGCYNTLPKSMLIFTGPYLTYWHHS